MNETEYKNGKKMHGGAKMKKKTEKMKSKRLKNNKM